MNSSDYQSILIYCMKQLSAYDFENLYKRLGITKYKTTAFLGKPWTMTKPVIINLADILGCSPTVLIHTFGCGLDGLSARDYIAIKNL